VKKAIKTSVRGVHSKHSKTKIIHAVPSNVPVKAGVKRSNDKLDPIVANSSNTATNHKNSKKNAAIRNSIQLSSTVEPVRGKIRPMSSSGKFHLLLVLWNLLSFIIMF